MKKLKTILSILRYLPWSIYFNFHYLPFKQAILLPILLYKPHLLKCRGTVQINSSSPIKTGMIRMGFRQVSVYPNTGITWENHGGEVVFGGNCSIGNNSYISIGKDGGIFLGHRFMATSSCKIIAYNNIYFSENTLIGWDCVIMDTDFHKLKKISGEYTQETAPVKIGRNNWIANGCLVLKGTETPDFCVFGARSVLNKKYEFEPYSLAVGNPVKIKTTGIYRETHEE